MSYDFEKFASAFRELRTAIEADPRLVAFVSSARSLERQAFDVARGAYDVPILRAPIEKPRIPNEQQARVIIGIVSTIPNATADLPSPQRMAIATVLANLVSHITWDVLDRYSHLIPGA